MASETNFMTFLHVLDSGPGLVIFNLPMLTTMNLLNQMRMKCSRGLFCQLYVAGP